MNRVKGQLRVAHDSTTVISSELVKIRMACARHYKM